MTRKQVYLCQSRTWANVLNEDDQIIYAKDIDGVNVWVCKDGLEQVKIVE